MELRIISPKEDSYLKKIEWNYAEIKAEVTEKMKEYTGLTFTEETIKDAKEDVSKLRKFRTAIEDARKAVKRKQEEPVKLFEAEVKEVVALIDEPINFIDRQIKEVEEKKKAEKKYKITQIYHDHIGNLKELLPFDKVFKSEYLNAAKSFKAIEKEITDQIDRVNHDLDTIEGLNSTYELQMKNAYIQTLDLAAALREKARLEDLEEKLEQRRQQEEAARRLAEEASQSQVAPTKLTQEPEQTVQAPVVQSEPPEDRYRVGLNVLGTKQELDHFCKFLKVNRIEYQVTEKPVLIV